MNPKNVQVVEDQPKMSKEELLEKRQQEIKICEMKINQLNRELAFKQEEVNNGVSLEKQDDFIDGKKPIYFIQNEMDQIKFHIEQNETRIKKMKEMMEEDVRKTK